MYYQVGFLAGPYWASVQGVSVAAERTCSRARVEAYRTYRSKSVGDRRHGIVSV